MVLHGSHTWVPYVGPDNSSLALLVPVIEVIKLSPVLSLYIIISNRRFIFDLKGSNEKKCIDCVLHLMVLPGDTLVVVISQFCYQLLVTPTGCQVERCFTKCIPEREINCCWSGARNASL